MFHILFGFQCDGYQVMGIARRSLQKETTGRTQYTKPLRNYNAVENNGSQLTGGALTSVVMATVRRVANLPR